LICGAMTMIDIVMISSCGNMTTTEFGWHNFEPINLIRGISSERNFAPFDIIDLGNCIAINMVGVAIRLHQ